MKAKKNYWQKKNSKFKIYNNNCFKKNKHLLKIQRDNQKRKINN